MRRRSGLIPSTLAALLLPLTCGVAAAQRWGLEALMQDIVAGGRPPQRYTETRESVYLQVPIVSRGILRVLPDGSLVKERQAPGFQRITIGRERIDLEDAAGGRRSFALSEFPGLSGFATGLTALFAGDPESLRAHFAAELRGDPSDWRLRLVPLNEGLASAVQQIQLDGGAARVRQISILEGNGDSTLLELEAIVQ